MGLNTAVTQVLEWERGKSKLNNHCRKYIIIVISIVFVFTINVPERFLKQNFASIAFFVLTESFSVKGKYVEVKTH